MRNLYSFVMIMILLALFAPAWISCDDDDDSSADGDSDTDSDGDSDTDTDSDSDTDTDSDGDIPAGGFDGVDNEDGTVTDETTGLMWQKGMKSAYMDTDLADAAPYCETLDLGGYDDWRLPSVEEFRSLIIECDASMIGGACNASDSCSDQTDCLGNCEGCEMMGASTSDGIYLDELFTEARSYSRCWTTTVAPYSSGMIFIVDFRNGSVGENSTLGGFNVKCVRDE